MTKSDRELGMDRSITRRDFLNGVSVAVGGAMIAPASADAAEIVQQSAAARTVDENYPPALTGMRGSHNGSMDAAHAMRDGKSFDAGEPLNESYDLIVVGAGMSGLAAAYFFRKKTVPDAKILILDNHDDFGGHARRVEFNVNGRLLIAKGGTSYIERPATFTARGPRAAEGDRRQLLRADREARRRLLSEARAQAGDLLRQGNLRRGSVRRQRRSARRARARPLRTSPRRRSPTRSGRTCFVSTATSAITWPG